MAESVVVRTIKEKEQIIWRLLDIFIERKRNEKRGKALKKEYFVSRNNPNMAVEVYIIVSLKKTNKNLLVLFCCLFLL